MLIEEKKKRRELNAICMLNELIVSSRMDLTTTNSSNAATTLYHHHHQHQHHQHQHHQTGSQIVQNAIEQPVVTTNSGRLYQDVKSIFSIRSLVADLGEQPPHRSTTNHKGMFTIIGCIFVYLIEFRGIMSSKSYLIKIKL